jgi:hypothetical protein
MNFQFDIKELLVRLFKYLFEGIVVATAAFLIPGRKLPAREFLLIGLIAAATFSILDMLAPAFAGGARSGAAFGIGANLAGFPAMGGPNPNGMFQFG